MSYVLGIDLGTSGLKGLLLRKDGTIIASSSSTYPIENLGSGYMEQDPENWYKAFIQVTKNILEEVPEAKRKLEGISFSGQMHSLVLINNKGEVVRNAILWNDVRTTKQCREIMDTMGEKIVSIAKNKPLEGFTLPKILWVQENEPELWDTVSKILLPKDYLSYRLTGEVNMELSDAAGTLLLDVEKGEWSSDILKTFNIEPSLCPSIVQSLDKVGYLSKEISNELGIVKEVPVFAGGADNACGAIGAGITEVNQAMCSIGTSGVFLSPEGSQVINYKGKLHFFNHVIPEQFYSMGVTLSAGNSLSWYKNTFFKKENYEEVLADIQYVNPGSDGLLFAPYLSGERTPYADSQIRGAFIGVDIGHEKRHFSRAVLEGVTFSLRDSLELIKKYSHKNLEEVVSVGGGAKNDIWLQIQADIFNIPVVKLKSEQGPAMGAAMIAAIGAEWFKSFAECKEEFVKYGKKLYPIEKNVDKYEEIYSIYRKMYPAIKDISYQLNKK